MYDGLDFVKTEGGAVACERLWLREHASDTKARLEEVGFRQGTVIDVGCNTGELVEAFAQLGVQVAGCDIDSAAVNTGRELGRNLFHLNLERDVPEDRYAAAIMIHTLEHTMRPVELLANLGRSLEPGAPLFIAVPNYGGLIPRIMRENWGYLVPMQHTWQFTPKTLRATVEMSGAFEFVKSTQRVNLEPTAATGSLSSIAKAGVLSVASVLNVSDEIRAFFRRI